LWACAAANPIDQRPQATRPRALRGTLDNNAIGDDPDHPADIIDHHDPP
jgi:hypothetical protein